MKSIIYRDILLFFKRNYKIIILIILLIILKAAYNCSEFVNTKDFSTNTGDLSQIKMINSEQANYTKEFFFEKALALTYDAGGIIELIYISLIIMLYIYVAVSVYFSDIILAPEQLFLRESKKKYIVQKFISIFLISILIDIIMYFFVFATFFVFNVNYFNLDILFVNIIYKYLHYIK